MAHIFGGVQQRQPIPGLGKYKWADAIGECLELVADGNGDWVSRFLQQAKVKSKALREIVEGNELFKRQNTQSAEAFKTAHKSQSSQTRQLVAEMKS